MSIFMKLSNYQNMFYNYFYKFMLNFFINITFIYF